MKNIGIYIAIGIAALMAIVLLMITVAALVGGWYWTGFVETPKNEIMIPGKTLWDWMDLLIVPLVLAIGAWFLKRADSKLEHEIADQQFKDTRKIEKKREIEARKIEESRAQEAVLETYLDRMSDLILKEKLHSNIDIARIRSLTTLRRLDSRKRNQMLGFLRDAELIEKGVEGSSSLFCCADMRKINLSRAELFSVDLSKARMKEVNLRKANLFNADLREADLSEADLREARILFADLREADFRKANLRKANLYHADLRNADLREADMRKADLRYADFRGANLTNANVTAKQLEKTKSIKGADLDEKLKAQLVEKINQPDVDSSL